VEHVQNKEWRDKEDGRKLNLSFVSTRNKYFRRRWKSNIKIDVKGLTGFSWFRIDCEGTDCVQLVQDRL